MYKKVEVEMVDYKVDIPHQHFFISLWNISVDIP